MTPDVEYRFSVGTHAETMLAWRYGLRTHSDADGRYVNAYFKKQLSEDSSSRRRTESQIRGLFSVDDVRRVRLVVDTESNFVVTALPSRDDRVSDEVAISCMLDALRAVDPDLVSVSEVISWREKYIDANGALNKDDFRRFVRTKAPSFSGFDPYEALGIEPSLFDEVANLRWAIYAIDEYLADFDPTKEPLAGSVDAMLAKIAPNFAELAPRASIYSLADYPKTWCWHDKAIDDQLKFSEAQNKIDYPDGNIPCAPVTPEELYKAMGFDVKPSPKTVEERKERAVLGIPPGAVFLKRHSDGTTSNVLHGVDIFAIEQPPSGEPWVRIFFKCNGGDRFINTRFGSIIDSYKVGDESIYYRDYGKAFFIESPPE